VTHHRMFIATYSFVLYFDIKSTDRVYCTLPLYHSGGGIIGLGLLLQRNVFVVLRKKFSASRFISDGSFLCGP